MLTGLCFIPQAAGAFALSGPAVSVLAGSLPGLLAGQFAVGVAAWFCQVASTLAGTHGPVAARAEGTASALLTASRQVGSALGVAVVTAMFVAVSGSVGHRTAVAMFVDAGFALVGLLASLVVPPGPPRRSRSGPKAAQNPMICARQTYPRQLQEGRFGVRRCPADVDGSVSVSSAMFTSTEVVYGVTGTSVTELPEYGVLP